MFLFNIFTIIAPLAGTVFAPLIALLIIGVSLLFKHGISIYYITFGLPTLIATLCWIVENQTTTIARITKILFNIVLPLACMIAFCVHPVGQQAFAYSLYWLMPPVLFLLSRAGREGTARNIINNSFILKTLNSSLRITFITHAIGSVLWLYAMPSTPIFWLALIPIVALERFCLAGATTAILSAIKVVKTHRLLASAKA